MARHQISLLIFLLALSSLKVFSQYSVGSPDGVYGYDPLLYNGRVYTYFPKPGTGGTQFLLDEFDAGGKVSLRGITFKDVELNYDLINQQLVLKYTNAIGSANLIELSAAWLQSFDLGYRHFEIINSEDTTKRIFQVLGNGPVQIRYYYYKEFLLDNSSSAGKHFFSEIHKEMYVSTGAKMLKYKNNSSFVKAFSPDKQDQIKKYLRKHKINVKKSNDLIITELLNNSILISGL